MITMHRSFRRRIEDRKRAISERVTPTVRGDGKKARFLAPADVATIASSIVVIAAHAFSYFQYKGTLQLQEQALLL